MLNVSRDGLDGSEVLKLIGRKQFEIALIQQRTGTYVVKSKAVGFSEQTTGEISDYYTAVLIFDQRLISLEGH